MIKNFWKSLCLALLILPGLMFSVVSANDLGSPAESRTMMSNDYDKLIDAAFPKYEGPALKAKFEAVVKKYPQGIDTIKVRSLGDIEKLLNLKTQQHAPEMKMFRQEDMAYDVHPEKGKVKFLRGVKQPMVLSKQAGMQRLPEFTRLHEDFLEKIGVPKDQIFYKETSLLMSQSSTSPQEGSVRKNEPVVAGVSTYVVRAVDGIIVEGSSAKVTTLSDRGIDAVKLKWPRFRISPSIDNFETKDRASLKSKIADRVRTIAGKGKANVKMAVVLLPVATGDSYDMVPVMKVAVMTENSGEGVIFYENLLKQEVEIEKPVSDQASGGPQNR